MNQQIEQLALQAGFNLHNDVIDGHNFKHEIEKFAELIVQECMQVVANQLPSNQYLDVAHAVIEHFGVEE